MLTNWALCALESWDLIPDTPLGQYWQKSCKHSLTQHCSYNSLGCIQHCSLKYVGHTCTCWPNGERAHFFPSVLPTVGSDFHPTLRYVWGSTAHWLLCFRNASFQHHLCPLMHIQVKRFNQPVNKVNISSVCSTEQQRPIILHMRLSNSICGQTVNSNDLKMHPNSNVLQAMQWNNRTLSTLAMIRTVMHSRRIKPQTGITLSENASQESV